MIFKTDVSRVDDLQEWIRKRHPYSIPAMLKGNLETYDGFYRGNSIGLHCITITIHSLNETYTLLLIEPFSTFST